MLTDTFHDLFERCRHKHAVVVKSIARAFLLLIKILENLVELLRYFIQAGVARSNFLDIVSEQLILDKRERQNAARPAILHLDVFAALLLNHHIWIDFTYGLPAFGLNNLKVTGNARPCIIESLIGIVFVNKRDTRKGIVKVRCNMLFFSHGVDLQCTVHQSLPQLCGQMSQRAPIVGQKRNNVGVCLHRCRHVVRHSREARPAAVAVKLTLQTRPHLPVAVESVNLNFRNPAEHSGVQIPALSGFGRIHITRNIEVVIVSAYLVDGHQAAELIDSRSSRNCIHNAANIARTQLVVFAFLHKMP